MKQTLNECIRQHNFYSIKFAEAVENNNIEMIHFYNDKICDISFYTMYVYKVDLDNVDNTKSN